MDRDTRRAPCPKCDRGPADKALAITIDERGTVAYCHRCGHVEHDNIKAAGSSRMSSPSTDPERLRLIWRRTEPLRGSLAERYLTYRRCALPSDDGDLRYLPPDERYPPSLCARVTDVVTREPISLHFTRLAPGGRGKAGTDLDRLLLAGHRKAGGCIRLWPDEAVTNGLAIAEGVESALAAAHGYCPVWSTIDAGNMAKFPLLLGIETLVIFADHDGAGLKAARACGKRWAEAGREVNLVVPPAPGTDIADVVAAACA